MAAPDMRICARAPVFDREFAIGLFRYKSFAANKGLYSKKLGGLRGRGFSIGFPGESSVLQAGLIGILYDELD